MKKIILSRIVLSLLLTSFAPVSRANECEGLEPEMEISTEEVEELSEQSSIEFCFNKFLAEQDAQLSSVTDRLRSDHPEAFTNDSCIKINDLPESSHADAYTMIRNVGYQSTRLNLNYQGRSSGLSFSRDSEEDRLNMALQETVAQVAMGSAINQSLYPGQRDKKLHSNYGAGISLVGSSFGYFVVRNSNLTQKQKERVVRYSGPLAALTIGILKEVLYDARHRDSHTVDKHDALATGIGGGLIPIRIEFKF